jgi:hypothetical protein
MRHLVVLRTIAAEAPWQHGRVEVAQRTLRPHLMTAWATFDEKATVDDLAIHVGTARNELSKVDGYSPFFAVTGRQRGDLYGCRDAANHLHLLTADAAATDINIELNIQRRARALAAFHEVEAKAKIDRAVRHADRPYAGPFFPGDQVMIFKEGQRMGHKNDDRRMHGPGTVIVQEGNSIVWISILGKIWKCAPEQLFAVHPDQLRASEAVRKLITTGQTHLVDPKMMAKLRQQDAKMDVIDARPPADARGPYEPPDGDAAAPPAGEPASAADDGPIPGGEAPLPASSSARSRSLSELADPPAVAPAEPPAPATEPPATEPPAPSGHSDGKAVPTPVDDDDELMEPAVHADEEGIPAHLQPLLPPRLPEPRPASDIEVNRSVADGRHPSRHPASSASRAASQEAEANRSIAAANKLDGYQPFRPAASSASRAAAPYTKEASLLGMEIDLGLTMDDLLSRTTQNDTSYEFWKAAFEGESAFAVSVKKKAKLEVKTRYLTAAEQAAFEAAKDKEWASWLANKVVDIASIHGVDRNRIINARWILTWKQDGTAKARLVLLGYQDPDLGTYRRDSPTAHRSSKNLMLFTCAQLGFPIFTLDAHTAFLSGDPTERPKPLYFKPPADLVAKLQLTKNESLVLLKAAYGLAEAPRAWWKRLRRELETCGWHAMELDECVMTMHALDSGKLVGIICVHVDDLLCGGLGTRFTGAMDNLCRALPFGKRKEGHFTYTGINHIQLTDGTITIDQNEYVDKIDETPAKNLDADETGNLRGKSASYLSEKVGSMLYATTNTRPLSAFDVSYLGSRCKAPTKADASHANKVIRIMKTQTTPITFRRIGSSPTLENLVFVSPQDAGWASRADASSQAGNLILVAAPGILDGAEVTVNLLDWATAKIKRVCRSSLGCETMSAVQAMDALEYYLCLVHQMWYGWTCRQFQQALTSHELLHRSALVTDCRGLYSHLMSSNAGNLQAEKRLIIDIRILMQTIRECDALLFWVNNNYQPADCLTKLSSAGARTDLLQLILAKGQYRITFCSTSGRKEQQGIEKRLSINEHEVDDAHLDVTIPKLHRQYIGDHDENEEF